MNSKSRGSSPSSAKISKKLKTPVATGLKNRNNKVIYVFKNGVTNQPAKKFVLTSFDYNNWGETLHNIGVDLKIKNEVNFLTTLNGLRVNVSELKNGGFYVAMCSSDTFRSKQYMKIYNKEKYAEFKSFLRNSFETEPPVCSPVLFQKPTERNNVTQLFPNNSEIFQDETNEVSNKAKVSNAKPKTSGKYQQNVPLPVTVVKVVPSNSIEGISAEENPLKRRVRSQSQAYANIPEMRLLSNESHQFRTPNKQLLHNTTSAGIDKSDICRKSTSKNEQVKQSKGECKLSEIRTIHKNRVSPRKLSPIKPFQRRVLPTLQDNEISNNSDRSSSISINSSETESLSKYLDEIHGVDVSDYHIISLKDHTQNNSKEKKLNEILNKINTVQSKIKMRTLEQVNNQKKNPVTASQDIQGISNKYLLKSSIIPSSYPDKEAQKCVTATDIGLEPVPFSPSDGLARASQKHSAIMDATTLLTEEAPQKSNIGLVKLPEKNSTNTDAFRSSYGRSRLDTFMPLIQKYKMKAGIRSKSAREERTTTDNSINPSQTYSAKTDATSKPLDVEGLTDDSTRLLKKYATKVDAVLKPIHEEESKTNHSVKPTDQHLGNVRFSNNTARLVRTNSMETDNSQSTKVKSTNKERVQTNNSINAAQSYALKREATSKLTPLEDQHTDKIMRPAQQHSMHTNATTRSTPKASNWHSENSKRSCQKYLMNVETRTEDPENSVLPQKEKRQTDDQIRSTLKKRTQFERPEESIQNEGSIRSSYQTKKGGLQNRVVVCSSKTNITPRLNPKERSQSNCCKQSAQHTSTPGSTQKEGSHTESSKRSCQKNLKHTDVVSRSLDKEETHTEGAEISTQKERVQKENSVVTQKEKRQTDDQIKSTVKKQSQCKSSERSIHSEGSVGSPQTRKGGLQNRAAVRTNLENRPPKKCAHNVKPEYPDWIEDLPNSLAEVLKQKKQNQKSTTKLQPQRRRKKFTKTTTTPLITDPVSEVTHPDVDISKELPKISIEENNGLGDTSKGSSEPPPEDWTKVYDVANTTQRVLVPINECGSSGNNAPLSTNSCKKPEKETRWSKYQQKFLVNNADQDLVKVPIRVASKKENKEEETPKDDHDFVVKDSNATSKLADILRQHLDLNKDENQSMKKMSNVNDRIPPFETPANDTNGSGDISKNEKVENCGLHKRALSRNNSNIILNSEDKHCNHDADSSTTSVNDRINEVQINPIAPLDYHLNSRVLLNVLNIGNNNKKKHYSREKNNRYKTKEGAVDKVRCKKSLMRESKICELTESELLWSDKILRKGSSSYNGFDNDSNCNQIDFVFGSFYNIYELIAEQELGDAVIETELSKQIAPIFQKNEIAESAESDSASDRSDLKEEDEDKDLLTFEEEKDDVESTLTVNNNINNREEEIITKENDPMMNQIENVEQITEVLDFEVVIEESKNESANLLLEVSDLEPAATCETSIKYPEDATFKNDGQFEIEALNNNLLSFNDESDFSFANTSKLIEMEILAKMQDTELMTQLATNGSDIKTNNLEFSISSSDDRSELVADQQQSTTGRCSGFVMGLAARQTLDALNTMQNVLDKVLEEPHYLENEAKFSSMYSIKDLFIESDDHMKKVPDVDLCVGWTLDSPEEDSNTSAYVPQNIVECVPDLMDNLQKSNSESHYRTEPNLQPIKNRDLQKKRHSLKKQSITIASSESVDYFPSFDDDEKDLRNGHLKNNPSAFSRNKKQVTVRKNVHSSNEEDEMNIHHEQNVSNLFIQIYDENDETRTKSQIFEISVGALTSNRITMKSDSNVPNLRLSIYIEEYSGEKTSGVVAKELSHKEEIISKPKKKITKFSLTDIYQMAKMADESAGSLCEHFVNRPEPFNFLDSSETTNNSNITLTKKYGACNTQCKK